MKLQEIFTQLAYGELSQIHMGGEDVGEIAPAYYEKLVAHINLGIMALHTRFFLKEERITLELQQGRYTYPLLRKYAVSNRTSRETSRYILDSATAPYRENIVKVEQVLTEHGWEFALNDKDNIYAINTPSINILTVPEAVVDKALHLPDQLKTNQLTVIYRATPEPITEDNGLDDPEETEVELPYSHLQALLYYVASRVNNPIGMTNEFHSGNNYAAKYEAECMRLEQTNLQLDRSNSMTPFVRNGWV